MLSELNYLAILVSGAIYWILGGIWYAAIFSKPYQAALNFSPEVKAQAQKDFPKALAVHFISGLISSVVLAIIVKSAGEDSFVDGMLCGLIMWLGFALTINLNYLMFEKRPTPLFLINNGFFLIAFAIIGGILAVWS